MELTTKICQIEQVVELPADEYKKFSEKLYMSYPFIRENIEAMYEDSEGVNHCLLVLGEGQEDGILVESEGADYARYAAHLSGARLFVQMEQYPALKQFGTQMIQAVDLGENKNLFVVAAILIPGIGGLTLSFGKVTITNIACALILGILANIMLSKKSKKNAK